MEPRRTGSLIAMVAIIGLSLAGIYLVVSDLVAAKWMIPIWVVLAASGGLLGYRYVRSRAVAAGRVGATATSRMAPADAAWLHMDEPDNPADIVLLMIFDESPALEAVRATTARRLLRFERFRQRVVEIDGRPHWQIDDDFDLENHVSYHRVDGPLTARRLAGVVAELGTKELAPERPLWSLHVVKGTDQSGAVVLRVHHCVGDGLALARAVAFSERGAGEPPAVARAPRRAPSPLRRATGLARSVGRLLRVPLGRETVIRGPLTGRRRMAWSAGFSLEIAKSAARSRGATLNDVFMAALTGALRRLLAERGALASGQSIGAIVPVNLRPARWAEEVDDSLGNCFGLFFIDLPVGAQTARERSSEVMERMRAGDRITEASVAFGILKALGRGPASLERFVSHVFARKASVVVSNVPGPRAPIYFGDKRIREVMFWEPHPGRLGMAISFLTYAGTIRMGARADEGIIADPHRLVALFEAELSVILEGSKVSSAA